MRFAPFVVGFIRQRAIRRHGHERWNFILYVSRHAKAKASLAMVFRLEPPSSVGQGNSTTLARWNQKRNALSVISSGIHQADPPHQ